MASSFGDASGLDVIDLTNVLMAGTDTGIPLGDTNAPLIITPLAYGGESVQDSYYRLTTMTYDLDFPSRVLYEAFLTFVGRTGTLIVRDYALPETRLHQVTGPVWYADDSVVCKASFSRRGYWA